MLIRPRSLMVLGAAAAVSSIVACAHRPAELSTVETTASRTIVTDDAVAQIGGALCEREMACGNIGAGKKYADQATCARATGHPELKSHPCPQHVTHPRLDACLHDIRQKTCTDKLELADEISTCKQKMLCFGE